MKIESFEIITLRESGMRITCEYEIVNKDDNAEVSEYEIRYGNKEDERVLMRRAVCSAEKMLKLLNDCKLLSWDGFNGKHPKYILDGIMFRFNATVNGDRTVQASGSENFPKHYREFTNELYAMLNEASK